MDDLTVHFSKTTPVKRRCGLLVQGVHISRRRGEKNCSNIWQWRRRLVIFTWQKEFWGPFHQTDGDMIFLGAPGREWWRISQISPHLK